MLSLTFNSHFRPHFPSMSKIQGKVSYWLYSILIPNASNMLSGGLPFCSWPLFLHSAEAPEKEGDGCCQGDLHLFFSKCSRQSSTENEQILWAEAQLKTRQSSNWRQDSVSSRGFQIVSHISLDLFWEPRSQCCKILLYNIPVTSVLKHEYQGVS